MLLQWIVFPIFFRIKIIGKNNLKKCTNAITISNHCHYLDPGLIAFAVCPRRIYFSGLENTFNNPFFSFFIRCLGGFPIPNNNPGRIIKPIGKKLKKDKTFIHIFPEGELFSGNQLIKPFKTGCISLSLFFNTPIIPIVEIQKKKFSFLPPKVIIVIGEPIFFSETSFNKERKKSYKILTEEIRITMQDMINLYS